MKTLVESLFDKDLTKKGVGLLTAITNIIMNFMEGSNTKSSWSKCIQEVERITDHEIRYPMRVSSFRQIKNDNFLFTLDIPNDRIVISMKDIYNESQTIFFISYTTLTDSYNIYADFYKSKTTTYNNIIELFHWAEISSTREEINDFIKNVLDKIEHVF